MPKRDLSQVYTRAKKYVTQAYKPPPGITMPAPPPALDKADRVRYLLAAKEASGKTFSAIAQEVGLTNVYTTQLFYLQVRASRSESGVNRHCSVGFWTSRHAHRTTDPTPPHKTLATHLPPHVPDAATHAIFLL